VQNSSDMAHIKKSQLCEEVFISELVLVRWEYIKNWRSLAEISCAKDIL